MFWVALVILILSITLFFLAVFPTFIIDISGISVAILGGLDYMLQYSGLLCFLLPMNTVSTLLGILIAFKTIEWIYYGVLYVVKIFK